MSRGVERLGSIAAHVLSANAADQTAAQQRMFQAGLLIQGVPPGGGGPTVRLVPQDPLATLEDPLDPLHIGKTQHDTRSNQCQDLWLDCKTCSCSLSYRPSVLNIVHGRTRDIRE